MNREEKIAHPKENTVHFLRYVRMREGKTPKYKLLHHPPSLRLLLGP